MASRLLSARKHSIAYWPNLTSIVRHFVSFTAEDASFVAPCALKSVDKMVSSAAVSRYDTEAGSTRDPLKPDQRFPLPGSVGLVSHHQCPVSMLPKCEVDLSVLNQFVDICCQPEVKPQPSSTDLLECVAQEIPTPIQKDFSDLFPDRDLGSGNLTVITLSQRTENDMTSWSQEVEEEREQLLGNFIAGATDICNALKQAGYWADFIDPSSGRPYLGAYTNATLFETDERYRKFGFDINDLGCCKVISHRLWGAHAYVGSLFTDAPMDHPAISKLAA